MRRRRSGVARRRGIDEIRYRRRQNFARQRQVDRPLRLRRGDVDGAVDGRFEHMRIRQLVIPLGEFPHHRTLVAHLLRPMDLSGALTGRSAFLGIRRAAGGKQDRDVAAPAIHQAGDRIGGANIDVHHHELRLAGLEVIAERHADRDVLMRDRHRPRHPRAMGLSFRQRLDQRGEIGPGIGKEVIDATVGKQCEIRISRRSRGNGLYRNSAICGGRAGSCHTFTETMMPAGKISSGFACLRAIPCSYAYCRKVSSVGRFSSIP